MDKGMGRETHDPLQYLISKYQIYLYLLQNVVVYPVDEQQRLVVFVFKSLHHPSFNYGLV